MLCEEVVITVTILVISSHCTNALHIFTNSSHPYLPFSNTSILGLVRDLKLRKLLRVVLDQEGGGESIRRYSCLYSSPLHLISEKAESLPAL